jgi:hypothetical protein
MSKESRRRVSASQRNEGVVHERVVDEADRHGVTILQGLRAEGRRLRAEG